MLPGATRFSGREGRPPVIRGWAEDPATGGERLVGVAFLTSEAPPEELGYNGPIDVLVGMDPDGTLTGIVVVDYYESLRASRGDFLARRGFQEQFAGKSVADAFRVRRDVDGISGATITVGAMARGIRNAARRVWTSHFVGEAAGDGAPPAVPGADELERLSWLEMTSRGLVQRITVLDDGVTRMEIFLLRVRDAEAGHVLLGAGPFDEAMEAAGERAEGRPVWMVGVDGALTALFRPQAMFLVQDGDTVRLTGDDAVMLGEPRRGKADAQFRNAGLLFTDPSVDVTRPFTFLFDMNNGMGGFTARHPGEPGAAVARAEEERVAGREEGGVAGAEEGAVAVEAEEGPLDELAAPGVAEAQEGGGAAAAGREEDGAAAVDEGRAGEAPAGGDAGASTATEAPTDSEVEALQPTDAPATGASAAEPRPLAEAAGAPEQASASSAAAAEPALAFEDDVDESVLARTLERTSWPRFAGVAALLVLASAAFFLKARPALRGVALAATLVFLGFGGGGFLSVSHLVAAVEVGPGVFLEDLPLLLLVTFTVVTTLLWGRVFCGYLCPFGVLQDAIDRVVPRRFRRQPSGAAHRIGLKAKYVVLAALLLPALAGSTATLFHWAEPFGTVFFLSPSAALWAIAGVVLTASAVVPRFYCRYACPLGASLALASLLSPFRIRRVEQCSVCAVCEQACPTGAIRRDEVDFAECVRCNACEALLERRAGVCRHDMGEVRSRLVQIRVSDAH